ncbi:hypothetical protein NBRC10512_005954 [Rhodotorula toruloides]|uniref:RHTO0S02e01904g1_1 n=2 Tax=Rhodotorula toruloides TaxID=5286 RepID=A0A061AP08_RHOTO|nr:SprT-like domain containing protein [Rhodotorula toruloides NP11]EMS22068.1 SprT-like domain containing protein [Rhodotorula toruloides NP11]CDR36419.1 RHTO0S02e01904g1_1 [Rhodotorula toruloides]
MARSVSRRTLAGQADPSDDELPPPSALLNTLATSARPRGGTPPPLVRATSTLPRRSPRLSGVKEAGLTGLRRGEVVGPTVEEPLARRSPRTPRQQIAQIADSPTSAEQHRLLAEELFPPSPPANVISSAAMSPDVIEDSDEERGTKQTAMSSTKTGRTASYENEEGDLLAKRLEMLGLSTPRGLPPAAPRRSPSVIPDSVASTTSPALSSAPSTRTSASPSRSPASRLSSKPPAKLSTSTRTRETRIEAETVVVQETQEDEEVILACTDDVEEEEALATGIGSKSGWWSEDVTETDGILIYEPTPRKRLVKLPSSRASPSPFLKSAKSPAHSSSSAPASKAVPGGRKETRYGTEPPAKDAKARGSKLRVEIDLTGESSEEEILDMDKKVRDDESLPPPPTRRRPTSPPSSGPAPPSSPHTPIARPKAPRLPSQPLPPRTPSSTSSVPRLTPKDRQALPLLLIRELDKSVFRKRWDGLRCLDKKGEGGRGKGLPEGIEVVWSKRLLKTAGRATWKRSRTATMPGSPEKTTTHQALVELSVKVTDTEAKLKHTLAHELCHLAAWAMDGEMKPPHGPAFKTWAKRVMLVRPDMEVTTTHSYEIVYKYRWQCTRATCGKIFSRHSNSINPSTHGCPCGSRIVPIDKDGNVKSGHGGLPSFGGTGGPATPKTERKKSKWVEFLQAQSPLIRRDNPSLPQSEVFKIAAERWKVVKAASATPSVPATPSKKAATSGSVALELDSDGESEGDLGDKLGRLEL